MKKIGKILSLALLIMMLTTVISFAGVNLTETNPLDGDTGVALENFGVKLTFDSEFSEEKLGSINDAKFELVGPYTVDKEVVEDYSFGLKVLYSTTNPNEILVLIDKDEDGKTITLSGSSEYTLTIKAGLVDDNGNALDSDKVLTFTTLNQQRNNTVNTLMMFAMMGVIVVVTMKSTRKQDSKDENVKKDEIFNPYREAKKTGKSVEEVIKEYEKKKAKEAKKAKAKTEKKKPEVTDTAIYLDEGQYYVTTKRKLDPEKSSYAKKYKEEQELKRAEIKRKKELAKQAKKAKKK